MTKEKGFNSELFFSALADRTRLRLLNLMRHGEVCVCFFAETIGTNNPKISRHLAYLKRANLVTSRREGKWMHYKINTPADPLAANVFSSTMDLLTSDAEMVTDLERLSEVCCSPGQPISIERRSVKMT